MGKTNNVVKSNIANGCGVIVSPPTSIGSLIGIDWSDPNTIAQAPKKESLDMHFPGAFDVKGHTVYIKRIIYSNPATIVFWSDGTKTVSKCSEDDIYSPEMGLSNCVLKKITNSTMHKLYSTWIPDELDYSKCTEWNLENVRHKEKEEEKKLKKLKKSSKNS